MSRQKTSFFSNTQIYAFIREKKKSPAGYPAILCENGNKELEKCILFWLVGNIPVGCIQGSYLFKGMKCHYIYNKTSVCKKDGEVSLG